jgi:hypothetical protein
MNRKWLHILGEGLAALLNPRILGFALIALFFLVLLITRDLWRL